MTGLMHLTWMTDPFLTCEQAPWTPYPITINLPYYDPPIYHIEHYDGLFFNLGY